MPLSSVSSEETLSATMKPLSSTLFLPVGSKWQYVSFDDNSATSTIAGYNSLGGFNYHVSGKRKDQTNNLLITLNIQNGVQWNSIQVSYFISSRNDFTVGHAIVEDFIWNYQNDGTVLATVDVPSTNIASNQQYDVAVFFSGLDSDAKGFSLRLLDDSYVNNTEKTLTIHF